MTTLYHLPYSPWSHKARWALDHHRIDYRAVEHLPMVGAPLLRWRARQWGGQVTVPLLVSETTRLGDSFDIALWADACGEPSRSLFGTERAAITRWNEQSERALGAARELVVGRTLQSSEALRAGLPAPLRRLGVVMLPAARLGAAYLRWKYGLAELDASRSLRMVREALDALREALGTDETTELDPESEPPTVLERGFSYADIAMAAALQIVEPLDSDWAPLEPVTRDVWQTPRLVDEYPDLVAWRDALFMRHGPSRSFA